MNRNHELNAPIDFDAYKARAQALRRQEIDRLLDRFGAWLSGRGKPQVRAGAPRAAVITAQASRC